MTDNSGILMLPADHVVIDHINNGKLSELQQLANGYQLVRKAIPKCGQSVFIPVDPVDCLRAACREGHLETAQWLVSHFSLTAEEARARTEFSWLHCGLNSECDGYIVRASSTCLQHACRYGHLGTAQWLVDRFQLTADDARARDNYCLHNACGNGHLAVAQWLVDCFRLTADDARADQNVCLRLACANNRLEVAQWLADRFQLTADDARVLDNECLIRACDVKHLGDGEPLLAQWLVGRFGLTADDARARDNYCLRITCLSGCLVMVQWLVNTFQLTVADAKANDNEPLQAACSAGCLGIAQWLVNRFQLTIDDVRARNNYCLLRACQLDRLDMVKWLVNTFQLTVTDVEMAIDHRLCARRRGATEWLIGYYRRVLHPAESAHPVELPHSGDSAQ